MKKNKKIKKNWKIYKKNSYRQSGCGGTKNRAKNGSKIKKKVVSRNCTRIARDRRISEMEKTTQNVAKWKKSRILVCRNKKLWEQAEFSLIKNRIQQSRNVGICTCAFVCVYKSDTLINSSFGTRVGTRVFCTSQKKPLFRPFFRGQKMLLFYKK